MKLANPAKFDRRASCGTRRVVGRAIWQRHSRGPGIVSS
jgi:hypothetical protein